MIHYPERIFIVEDDKFLPDGRSRTHLLTQPKHQQIEYYITAPFGWVKGLGEFD